MVIHMKCIIVCGDRHFRDVARIRSFLSTLPKDVIVLEGGATGADTIAREQAFCLGLRHLTVEANWKYYGLSAGPIRNGEMLKYKPYLVVAFHYDLSHSKGTANMLRQARLAHVPTLVNP